jgi:hypothetical protein
MRKFYVLSIIALFSLLSTVSFANVFASDISANPPFDPNLGQSTDVEYRLNSAATSVTVTIISDSSGLPVRALDGTTNRGINTVTWDGKDEVGANVPFGLYNVQVKAYHKGFPGWLPISAIVVGLSDSWTQDTSVYGGGTTGNQARGIAYNGTNLIVSGTDPRMIGVLSAADGSLIGTLGLTVDDTYDADGDSTTVEAWSLDGWLGPYDLAAAGDQRVYLGAFRGASFPISRIESDTPGANPVAVAIQDTHSRAIDAVGAGVNTVLYQVSHYSTTPPGNPMRVFTSADDSGTTFALLETTTQMMNSHMIVAREGNTGGDGDVVWVSSNTGNVERWDRVSGSWVQDVGFNGPANVCGGDYGKLGNYELLFVIRNSDNMIIACDANSGEIYGTWDPAVELAKARDTFAGNGDLCYDGGTLYFGLPDFQTYGAIDVSGWQPEAQNWWSNKGIATVTDQADCNFGRLLVGNTRYGTSGNPGSVGEQPGIYLLNADLTWEGGSEAAAFATGNPACTWDDYWYDPYRIHAAVPDTEGLFYAADWASAFGTTVGLEVWYGDSDWSAASVNPILSNPASTYHGEFLAAVAYGTGGSKVLYTADNWQGPSQAGSPEVEGGYKEVHRYDIGTVVSDYDTTPVCMLGSGTSPILYHIRDIDVDSAGDIYAANYRWDPYYGQPGLVKASSAGGRTWSLLNGNTYTDGAWVAGTLAQDMLYAVAVDRPNNRSGVICRYGFFQVIPNDGSGAWLIESDPFLLASSDSYCEGMAVDAAGNFIMSSTTNEQMCAWSPPGVNEYVTDSCSAVIEVHQPQVGVDEWMMF